MNISSKVVIVIVNYCTAQLVKDCLQSLKLHIPADILPRVFIADNNSHDNSIEIINGVITEKNYQSWACVVPLETNGGFAYGNNRIIERVMSERRKPDFIWLLNPDTRIEHDALSPLLEYLQNNVDVGIAGSRLLDSSGNVQVSAFRFHSVISEFLSAMKLGVLDDFLESWLVAPKVQPEQVHNTDWVSGASFMVRRQVFEEIGLLDEQFFMYYEEVDFCRRANHAGWGCAFIPESTVVHLEGGASGLNMSNESQKRRPVYWFDSRRRYFLKNHGRITLILADTVFIFGSIMRKVRLRLQRKYAQDPPYFLKDFIRNSFIYKGFNP